MDLVTPLARNPFSNFFKEELYKSAHDFFNSCALNPNLRRVGPNWEPSVQSDFPLRSRGRNPWMCQSDVVLKLPSLSSYLRRSKLGKSAPTRHNFGFAFCLESADLDMADGKVIVLMGVSGAGKTTIGKLLAGAMDCPFLDADDFHSESNKEMMRKGIPLTDKDRSPWLISLRDELSNYVASGKAVVCACSALRRQYREILRSADPNYRPGENQTCKAVRFVLLQVSEEVLADRVKRRMQEEAHFMPVTLLKSQLALLELDESEGVVCVDGTQSGPCVVKAIQDQIS